MKKLILTLVLIVYSLAIANSRALKTYQEKYKNEKKIALVIGNGYYYKFPKLPNAINDARDVRNALKNMGFEVIYGENLTKKEIKKKLRYFERLVSPNSVALFYYAGHGLEVDNKNYIVPLKSDIEKKIDVPDEAISLNRVIRGIKPARLKILVVDACRNDPFSRSIETHFAPLNADGTIISFATSSGDTASENRNDRNGLFTKYFLQTLNKPNLNQVEFFREVRKKVYLNSNKTQKPAIYDETIGDFYFNLNLNQKTYTPQKSLISFSDVPSKYSLTIHTIPYNAKIYITNIHSQYYDGIMLKPAKYNIKVVANGYYTKKGIVDLKSNLTLNIKLKKIETKKIYSNNYSTALNDKTWIDPDTGLMWQVNISKKKYNWNEAKKYCSNLNYAGYSDWKLPNIDELKSILSDKKNKGFYIKPIFIDSIKDMNFALFWSSTIDSFLWIKSSSNAMVVEFWRGYSLGGDENHIYYVRCVRKK